MNYDHRALAEIAVLADLITAIDTALADAACRDRHPGARRAHLFAVVLYELIVSARTVVGPDGGRLYAAPILDSVIDDAPAADELSILDLLVPVLVARHITNES
ncbi:hypothetical protein OHA40_23305 [Nocardia sp. NBC_00508]|uniref:hypothetical protein n=1 Tax=Nocardia sp. NBC_00508 TaxID=2975992 RepID=UPI002E819685|nr:hypothetical protein [Nocardia sp. NBC_00508]WUD64597.1 hypothetical protein OHA40_23305 [Nocardia sp. NBC_00508]